MLRVHKVKQLELRLVLGLRSIKPETLVFSTIEGELLSADNLSRDWGRARRRFKLPAVSFHALRHTHASMLIASGVDILTVSRRLGHSSPTITLSVYAHLISGTDDRAAAIMDAALGSKMVASGGGKNDL